MSRDAKRPAAALIWILFAAVGCGPNDLVTIEGEVTLDGQPIERAIVRLVPLEAGGKKTGGEVRGGRYEITEADGLIEGRYRVECLSGEALEFVLPGMGIAYSHESAEIAATRQVIPERFGAGSPLTVEVHADMNKFDVQMTTLDGTTN